MYQAVCRAGLKYPGSDNASLSFKLAELGEATLLLWAPGRKDVNRFARDLLDFGGQRCAVGKMDEFLIRNKPR